MRSREDDKLYIPPIVLSAAVAELGAFASDIVAAHAILTDKLALVGRNARTELLLVAKATEEGTFATSACF